MKRIVYLAPLFLAGCSFVGQDNSYRPPPDPVAGLVGLGILVVMLTMCLGALSLPALLEHQRKMREAEVMAQTNVIAEVLKAQLAVRVSQHMGWPLHLAVQHVQAMGQIGPGFGNGH